MQSASGIVFEMETQYLDEDQLTINTDLIWNFFGISRVVFCYKF